MSDSLAQVTLKQWIFAMRPWSFTAAAIPVLFGAGLAALGGSWNTSLFALTLVGGIALQAGTNLHNTYGDYISKVDSLESAITCPQLVTGQITPAAMYKAGWLAFGVSGIIALLLTWLCGPFVLLFACLGIAGGYWYTNGKNPYKYAGLGPYFVFLLMGPLMALPAYAIQTGHFSLAPALGALSISCLVANIMHANDIRDITHDQEAQIKTVALRLGHLAAVRLFLLLNVSAFVILGTLIAAQILPLSCALPFILIPFMVRTLKRVTSPGYDFTQLEGWAAQFHLQFGLCLALGLALPLAFHLIKG